MFQTNIPTHYNIQLWSTTLINNEKLQW